MGFMQIVTTLGCATLSHPNGEGACLPIEYAQDVDCYPWTERRDEVEVELHPYKWAAHLSAPGYMDQTDWDGPYDTEELARKAIIDTYDLCAVCEEDPCECEEEDFGHGVSIAPNEEGEGWDIWSAGEFVTTHSDRTKARVDAESIVEEIDQAEIDSNPSPEDYIVSDRPRVGYDVSIVEGAFIGNFPTETDAVRAIREHRAKTSPEFYPNVWFISDHGNASCYGEPGFGEPFDWTVRETFLAESLDYVLEDSIPAEFGERVLISVRASPERALAIKAELQSIAGSNLEIADGVLVQFIIDVDRLDEAREQLEESGYRLEEQ